MSYSTLRNKPPEQRDSYVSKMRRALLNNTQTEAPPPRFVPLIQSEEVERKMLYAYNLYSDWCW